MSKFKTGEKWLRSDGKVCVLAYIDKDGFMSDQDGCMYYPDGSRCGGYSLVSRVVSDDELVSDFIENYLVSDDLQYQAAAKRIQAQSKLLEELKQLIAESQVKGAAMITKIEEL